MLGGSTASDTLAATGPAAARNELVISGLTRRLRHGRPTRPAAIFSRSAKDRDLSERPNLRPVGLYAPRSDASWSVEAGSAMPSAGGP